MRGRVQVRRAGEHHMVAHREGRCSHRRCSRRGGAVGMGNHTRHIVPSEGALNPVQKRQRSTRPADPVQRRLVNAAWRQEPDGPLRLDDPQLQGRRLSADPLAEVVSNKRGPLGQRTASKSQRLLVLGSLHRTPLRSESRKSAARGEHRVLGQAAGGLVTLWLGMGSCHDRLSLFGVMGGTRRKMFAPAARLLRVNLQGSKSENPNTVTGVPYFWRLRFPPVGASIPTASLWALHTAVSTSEKNARHLLISRLFSPATCTCIE